MADERVTLMSVQIDMRKANEQIGAWKKEIEDTRKVMNDLNGAVENGIMSQEEYNEAVGQAHNRVRELNQNISTLTRQFQNQRKANEENEGSLVQLRAQLSNLTTAYDKLSREERESGEQGKALRDAINATTTEIKNAEEATQRYYRNVGNYQNAIQNAIGANSKWFQGLQTISTAMQGGFKNAMTTATGAVSTFGKQLLALLANPIVAVIAGIVAVVTALASAIKSDEEATNSLQRILAPFKGLLDMVTLALQNMVTFILKGVEGFENLAMGLSKLAEKLPVVGNAFKNVNTAMNNQLEATKAHQKATEMEREQAVKSAQTQNEIAKLRNKVAQSDKYTQKERRDFLKQAIALEKQEAQQQQALAKQKLKALQLEAENTKNTAEMKLKLAQAEAEVIKADTAYYELTRRMQSQLAQFDKQLSGVGSGVKTGKSAKEIAQERAKVEKDAIKSAEDALLAYINNNYEMRITQTNLQYKREIEALEERLKTEKNLTLKAREALEVELKAKQYAWGEALAKIYEEQEKDYEEAEKKKIEAQKAINDDMLASKKKDYQEDLRELQNHLNNALLAEKLRADEVLKIQRDELQKELDLLLERGRLADQTESEYAEQVLNARKKLADATKKINDEEIKNEEAKNKAMKDMANALIGLTETLGESNKAFAQLSKVLALAQIAISTGEAIAKGVSQAQSVPFPANIGAIATTITAVLTGITQAYSAVNSAKFATGGYVSGAGTGTSDSIPARLSNGEFVMNAKSTSMYRPLLEQMNDIGLGVAPQVMGSYDSVQQVEEMTEAFKAGAMEIRPVVSVQDINRGQKRVEVIEKLDVI